MDIPRTMVAIPIITFNSLAFIFFTVKAASGAARIEPMLVAIARP